MPTVVFDIDGTLTDTVEVDAQCYMRAVRTVLGTDEPFDWESLPDMTDGTIIRALWARDHDGPFDLTVEERVRECLKGLFAEELGRDPSRFRPMPGATRLFDALRRKQWSVAIATGAWRPSAEFKLNAAGIPIVGVPLATASEAVGRQEIIGLALRAAGGDGRAVYVGDGPWDVRAARASGLPFIGVGSGRRADLLRAEGADIIVSDFQDPDGFTDLVAEVLESTA